MIKSVFRRGPSASKRSARRPVAEYYVHDDPLGSTSVIAEVNGDAADARVFTPFGEERTGIDWNQTGVLSGFTGHRHDPELGLINMRGRLYDSRLGRFTSGSGWSGIGLAQASLESMHERPAGSTLSFDVALRRPVAWEIFGVVVEARSPNLW
jgi:RHS repeat-associated protein